jgi:polar amino acid transport system permease protein
LRTSGVSGRRSTLIALLSTLVFAAVIVLVVANAPGWPAFKQAFFDPEVFRESLEVIPEAFLVNVKIFLIAEALILPFALLIAVLRSLQGPVFFPLRALAVVYADLFRGIPTILVISILGFGMPALGLSWVPISQFFWAVVALVLVYTAYVSEVYRSGIESVHPSQEAAARSLGLSHGQSLRFVVLPQAVRIVIPPLGNDFVAMIKDSALVSALGVQDITQLGKVYSASTFLFFETYNVVAYLYLVMRLQANTLLV